MFDYMFKVNVIIKSIGTCFNIDNCDFFLIFVSMYLFPFKQQGGQKPKGPLDALRPKLQVSLQNILLLMLLLSNKNLLKFKASRKI